MDDKYADPRIAAVLAFWFSELTPDDWFKKSDATDALIAERFQALHTELAAGVPQDWLRTPHGAVAAIIVLDQFPRNIYRNTPHAFASDALALALSKTAIAAGQDAGLTTDERVFLYMPFQHSEDLADQQRALTLFQATNEKTLTFAHKHHDVIAEFGRFPHRNAILGRTNTPEEEAYLAQPGAGF